MERNRFGSLGSSAQLKGKALKRAGGFMLAVLAAGLFSVPGAQGAITWSGNLNSDPSTWTSSYSTEAQIGNTAYGTVTVDGGSTLNSYWSYIGYAAGVTGEVFIDGTGSTWNSAGLGRVYVGYYGNGYLNVSNGGIVTTSPVYVGFYGSATGNVSVYSGGSISSNEFYVGYSGNGTATVDGAGSSIASSGSLTVGYSSQGTLNILNGATVTVKGNTTISPMGMVNFGNNGGTINTGSLLYSSSQLSGSGTINTSGMVSDGALVFDATHGASQSFNVNGVMINLNQGGSGSLGTGYSGSGTLTIADGVSVTSSSAYVGLRSGSTGAATITGSGTKWTNSGSLYVGDSGTGSLNINNGGQVSNTSGYVGYNSGSAGTVSVNGNGSTWINTSTLYVGYNGIGNLSITNGGKVSNNNSRISNNTGASGSTVSVNGSGSSWSNAGTLYIGYTGSGTRIGKLSISDGGAVTANTVSINAVSSLTTDIGKGSSLTVGGGTGTITNNGIIRLVAGAGAANGTYTPVSAGTWAGTGTVQALGGIWDLNNHAVTVSNAITGTAGSALTADLATTQRFLFTDSAAGKSVGAGFQATASPTNLTMTASAISGSELTSLQSLLGTGQAVLSGWDFNVTEGYAEGNPVYLSLFAGTGHSLYDLAVWHYDGSSWSKFDASDLAYDNNFASFTATGLSGYAVTGTAPVPIPAAAWLLGSGLMGLVGFRRKPSKA